MLTSAELIGQDLRFVSRGEPAGPWLLPLGRGPQAVLPEQPRTRGSRGLVVAVKDIRVEVDPVRPGDCSSHRIDVNAEPGHAPKLDGFTDSAACTRLGGKAVRVRLSTSRVGMSSMDSRAIDPTAAFLAVRRGIGNVAAAVPITTLGTSELKGVRCRGLVPSHPIEPSPAQVDCASRLSGWSSA